MTRLILLIAYLLAGPAFAGGDEIVLRTGTLADFDRTTSLVYDQSIQLARAPDLADREIGQVLLSGNPADPDDVLLRFEKGDAARKLGSFPQSVGNPLFMYFAETIIRDMAGFAGGSPFYIRNRVKDALLNRVTFTEETASFDGADIAVTRAVMRPFADDPNRERMQGFQDLVLTVIMSEDVTGWYLSLDATAKTDGEITYQRRLELQP